MDEPPAGSSNSTSPDITSEVIAQVFDINASELSEPLLNLDRFLCFDHDSIEAVGADGARPLYVRLRGRNIVLLIPAERLGVLLQPADALALGHSLIATAEELE